VDTGFLGTFVISWAQTEIDGMPAGSLDAITPGRTWLWDGDMVRVDGPADVLQLAGPLGSNDMRKRAAQVSYRLARRKLDQREFGIASETGPLALSDQHFDVTDGSIVYRASVIAVAGRTDALLSFQNAIPPRSQELWIAAANVRPAASDRDSENTNPSGLASGTWIETAGGSRRVEDLREGDHVWTKDCGCEPVLWVGRRNVTGARLFAMPELRPVRIRWGAFGIGRPDGDLIVAPHQKLLISGSSTNALFNASEVLVEARDLVDDAGVVVDLSLTHVQYVYLVLRRQGIIRANGVEVENPSPDLARDEDIQGDDLGGLWQLHHDRVSDMAGDGSDARRVLKTGEAAILRHAA